MIILSFYSENLYCGFPQNARKREKTPFSLRKGGPYGLLLLLFGEGVVIDLYEAGTGRSAGLPVDRGDVRLNGADFYGKPFRHGGLFVFRQNELAKYPGLALS